MKEIVTWACLCQSVGDFVYCVYIYVYNFLLFIYLYLPGVF